MNLDDFTREDFIEQILDKADDLFNIPDNAVDLSKEIVEGVIDFQSTLVESGVKNQLEEVIENITNTESTSSEEFRYSKKISEGDFSIVKLDGNRTSDRVKRVNIVGQEIFFNLKDKKNGYNFQFKNSSEVKNLGHITTTLEEAVINNPTKFNIVTICSDKIDLDIWPNGNGVIKRDLMKRIDQLSYIDSTSAICDLSDVNGFIRLTGDVVIDAPRSRILAETSEEFINGGEVQPDLELNGDISIVEKNGSVLIDFQDYLDSD